MGSLERWESPKMFKLGVEKTEFSPTPLSEDESTLLQWEKPGDEFEMQYKHIGGSLKCPWCGETFDSLCALINHIIDKHLGCGGDS